MTSGELTILVPAWKTEFLQRALDSLAGQTEQGFAVLVVDDAGPSDIARICEGFPRFRYVRFEENLGGKDLVGHWARCLELVETEWVCLFSDDDELEKDCVRAFLEAQSAQPELDVFAFDPTVIGRNGETLHTPERVGRTLSGTEFAKLRMEGRLWSFMPDHVFRKTALDRGGGFVRFPLAWNSDDATWVLLAGDKGIGTIPGPRVRWRWSGDNISSRPELALRKLEADRLYLDWISTRCDHGGDSRRFERTWIAKRIVFSYGLRSSSLFKLARILGRQFVPIVHECLRLRFVDVASRKFPLLRHLDPIPFERIDLSVTPSEVPDP